jgi:hypothetical protein
MPNRALRVLLEAFAIAPSPEYAREYASRSTSGARPPSPKQARIDSLTAANRAPGSLPPIGGTPVNQMMDAQIEYLGRPLLGYLTRR